MLLTMIMSSMMITSASAMFLAMNPLSMGIIILMMALTLAIIYSSMMSSWIAFLLFLIYVSGMLVMFAYFVALTPNQQMNTMMFIPMMSSFLFIFLLTTYSSLYPIMTNTHLKFMNIFYLSKNISMLMILALILLFTMIVVVKLVTNNKGPLRPFMN